MRKRRGVSTLELLVCLALLLAMAAVAAQNFLRGSATVKKDALEALSGEIRAIQQRAFLENKLVALTLTPSATQVLGTEVGTSFPRLEKVRDFHSDFPDVWLTCATPTQLTSPDAALNDSWFSSQRAAIIFTPDARIFSNLAADGQGYFHLGLARAGGGQWDVRLAPQGDLQVIELTNTRNAPPALSQTLKLLSTANQAPNISGLKILSSSTLPRAGDGYFHLSPAPGQLITFQVEARDDDGDDHLTLEGQGEGHFSTASSGSMTFDATRGRWVGHLTWSPPTTPTGGTQLHFLVKDRSGAVAVNNANSTVVVDGLASEGLVFAAQLNGDQNNRIYRANPDGSGLREIFPAGQADKLDLAGPVLSPQGTLVAFLDCTAWPPSVCVSGTNGTGLRVLCPGLAQNGSMSLFWSADSSKVIVSQGPNKIMAYPAAGGAGQVVATGVQPEILISSPDHKKLAYLRSDVTPNRIEVLDLTTSTATTVATPAAGTQFMMSSCDSPICFSADSQTLFYTVYDSSSQNAKIFSWTAPGPAVQALDTGDRLIWLRSGPGKKLAYVLMASGQRPLYSWGDYSDSSTKVLVDQRASNSIYAGCPDRFELSPDGNRIYWMQGLDTGSNLIRYDFGGGQAIKISKVGSYFQCPDSNGLSLLTLTP